MRLNAALPHLLAGAVLAAAADVRAEIAGRTWDRLSEAGRSAETDGARPLAPGEAAALAGRQIPLCMVGDSITWAQDGDAWRRALVARVPSLAFVGTHTGRYGYSHAGEGGNSTAGVRARIDDPRRIPDCPFYHLMVGINDCSAAKSPEEVEPVAERTAQSVAELVDRLLAKPATRHVLLASILPIDGRKLPFRDRAGSRVNEILRASFATRFPTNRVTWVEYEKPLRADLASWLAPDRLADGIHPAPLGYERLADILAPHLAKLSSALPPPRPAPEDPVGVRVENLWDAERRASRPLIPGWYVVSFALREPDAANAAKVTARLFSETERPDARFDKTFSLEAKPGIRCAFSFMTGYEGYGYAESPFRLAVTDATGRTLPWADVQVEKMRPSRLPSRYGTDAFVDSQTPACAGELLVR